MNNPKGTITKAGFGQTADGKAVEIYTLKNTSGAEARIITYGGIVQSLILPDKTGKLEDIVLGYDTLGGYLTNNPYFGALIGRYGNRIGCAKFSLNGQTYTLAKNNGLTLVLALSYGGRQEIVEGIRAIADKAARATAMMPAVRAPPATPRQSRPPSPARWLTTTESASRAALTSVACSTLRISRAPRARLICSTCFSPPGDHTTAYLRGMR